MSLLLHQDPARRCKPIEEWPELDRDRWLASLVPGDLLDEGGSRARCAEPSNLGIVSGYGRWLQWLDYQGELDRATPPGERITPVRVRAYLQDQRARESLQCRNCSISVSS